MLISIQSMFSGSTKPSTKLEQLWHDHDFVMSITKNGGIYIHWTFACISYYYLDASPRELEAAVRVIVEYGDQLDPVEQEKRKILFNLYRQGQLTEDQLQEIPNVSIRISRPDIWKIAADRYENPTPKSQVIISEKNRLGDQIPVFAAEI